MNINRADGWVKLYKSILNSDLAEDINSFVVFIRMLGMAHHEDGFASIRFGGEQVKLKRGEFSATLGELADYFDLSKSTLQNVIERLKRDTRIGTRTDRQKTIFSICNYEKYQGSDIRQEVHERYTRGTREVHVTDTKRNKEIKKNIYKSVSDETARSIYLYYLEAFGQSQSRYKLTEARRRKLQARLRENGSDALKRAVTAVSNSPFHRGDNDRGWKADLDFIIRSYEQVEKFANLETELKPLDVEEALRSL
jgi:hypothetical protein